MKGFQYFTNDVNIHTDVKVRRLRRRCGFGAFEVYHAILCDIYREGYYIEWNEDYQFLLSESLCCDEDTVKSVVDACLDLGLFDRNIFSESSVLTSRGIQERYTSASKSLKREKAIDKYQVLSETSENFRKKSEKEDDSAKNSGKTEKIPEKIADSDAISENFRKKSDSIVSKEGIVSKESNYSFSSFPFQTDSEEEKQQEISFLSEFFFRNYIRPREQLDKCIAYNRTGGRNWDRMTFKERSSCITLWRPKDENGKPTTAVRFGEKFLVLWRWVFQWMLNEKAPDEVLAAALSDGLKAEKDGRTLWLTVKPELKDFIERNLDAIKPALLTYLHAVDCNQVRYHRER